MPQQQMLMAGYTVPGDACHHHGMRGTYVGTVISHATTKGVAAPGTLESDDNHDVNRRVCF